MNFTLWDRLRADHGRIFMWVLVWLFTLSSVAINCAHALDAMPAGAALGMVIVAAVVAGFFPFAGLVMTEAVLIMIRSWRTGRWWVTAMQALLVLASMVMLVVAFWRSFNALTEMAVLLAMPASDAWMLPVLTDTGIVVGTLGVVLAEIKIKIDGDAAAIDEVTVERGDDLTDEVTSRLAGRGDELVSSWADELSDDVAVGVTTSPDDIAGGPVTTSPVELASTSSPAARHPAELAFHPDDEMTSWTATPPVVAVTTAPDEQGVEFADDVTTSPDEQGVDFTGDVSSWPDEQGVEVGGEVTTSGDGAVTTSSDEFADDLDEHWRQLADEVMSASKIAADPRELARVLALDAEGAPKATIAETVGRSRSTITGWIKSAEKVAGERPVLVAVGGANTD